MMAETIEDAGPIGPLSQMTGATSVMAGYVPPWAEGQCVASDWALVQWWVVTENPGEAMSWMCVSCWLHGNWQQ